MFTAKLAKKIVEKFKKQNLNYQRSYYLDRIKEAASTGKTFIVLDSITVRLIEDDLIFFEKLGYSVKREKTIKLNPSEVPKYVMEAYPQNGNQLEGFVKREYGIISW